VSKTISQFKNINDCPISQFYGFKMKSVFDRSVPLIVGLLFTRRFIGNDISEKVLFGNGFIPPLDEREKTV